jgi:hypothetical protein
MNAIVDTNTADTNTAGITVTEVVKAPRDKCKRAREIYDGEIPNQEAMGMRAWRSHVLNRMQAELPCTLAASVAHYNNARIANGGGRRVLGPRKNKEAAAQGEQGNTESSADAAQQAPASDVWCVEKRDGSKAWYLSEDEARKKASKLKDAKVYVDNDVEA